MTPHSIIQQHVAMFQKRFKSSLNSQEVQGLLSAVEVMAEALKRVSESMSAGPNASGYADEGLYQAAAALAGKDMST